ncbi:MAG: restriction endonuclease subunit S [Xanthomonadaceae bacterium]|nr:restriction endonuclease subunit S [Xanthomonadaceae bacterium]
MPDKKKAVVPRLRFPEFRDAGPWEVKRLYQLADKKNDRNKSGAITKVLTNSAEYGVIDQRDFFDKDIAQQGALENYFLVNNGDFVYNPRISNLAPVGPISINKLGLGVMSPLYTVFRFKRGINEFYAYFFESSAWHSYLLKVSNTGARHDRMAISTGDFMAMPVPDPSIEEQQKIADCLSSLDDLIEAEEAQLTALREHKKGLLQQLFPREGETTPRLRFPEFRDAGPWEVKRLGEIGTILKGKGISKSDISEQGSLPCIRYGELYTHYSEVVRSVRSFTNVDAADLVLSEENDVIIPASGETMEDIATASCVTTKGVALGGDLNIFRSSVNGVFLAYYIRGTLKPAIAKIAQGISVVHLYPTQLAQLQLGVPHSEEQQKIADCLSSLDELIELQAKRLDAIKAYKKGLLQQLFPQEVV